MNPEFQRNLWLELPTHRLIAMPAVLMLVFLATWLGGGLQALPPVAEITLALLLIVWGSRLAADSVISEVTARTWDNQRMSDLGPVEMTWGKLLGATIYVWYGALWCVAAFLLGDGGDETELVRLLLLGLQAQALALLVSLLLLRRGTENLAFQVTISQVAAILVVLPFLLVINASPYGIVLWFGLDFPQPAFLLVSQAIFVGFTIVGVYRLMRAELQYRGGQGAWLLFVVYTAVYVAGFDGLLLLSANWQLPSILAARFAMAFCACVALTYVAAFVEPKGFVRLRRWVQFAQTGKVDRVMEMMPTWMISAALGGIAGLLTLGATALATPNNPDTLIEVGSFILAMVLFCTRDVAMVYYLVLHERSRRGHLTALVYLVILYLVLPVTLLSAPPPLMELTPIFWPSLTAAPAMTVLPVLGQALVALVLALRRWRLVRSIEAMDKPSLPDGMHHART